MGEFPCEIPPSDPFLAISSPSPRYWHWGSDSFFTAVILLALSAEIKKTVRKNVEFWRAYNSTRIVRAWNYRGKIEIRGDWFVSPPHNFLLIGPRTLPAQIPRFFSRSFWLISTVRTPVSIPCSYLQVDHPSLQSIPSLCLWLQTIKNILGELVSISRLCLCH